MKSTLNFDKVKPVDRNPGGVKLSRLKPKDIPKERPFSEIQNKSICMCEGIILSLSFDAKFSLASRDINKYNTL